MKTDLLIQQEFLKLIETESVENISVNLICNNLNIKRQTFYYHYQSVYDLIYSIFYSIKISPEENKSFYENIGVLQGFFKKFEVLIKAILDSFAENILSEVVNSYIHLLLLKMENKTNVARFYSYGITEIIISLYKKGELNKEKLSEELKGVLKEDLIIK